MPEETKLKLSNVITIVGLIVACSVSYVSLQSQVKSNKDINDKQDRDIKGLWENDHRAELQRRENSLRYEQILESNRRIEEWIRSIDKVEPSEGR